MTNFWDGIPIRDLEVETLRMLNSELETWCERMLVDPEGRGVMVILEEGGRIRHFMLDANVPFGHVFEFPSHEAVEAWRARGCPR